MIRIRKISLLTILVLSSTSIFYNFSIWKSKKNKNEKIKNQSKKEKVIEPGKVEENLNSNKTIKDNNSGNANINTPVVTKKYPDLVYAAQIATEAVVHIRAIQESKEIKTKRRKMPIEEFLEKFFNEKLPQIEGRRTRPRIGIGSGVILSSDGYIVTNNHVIEGADKVEVTLYDSNKFEATVIGQDFSTDLAIIKIKRNSLPYINFGNSDDLKVGQWVLAVGNPLGLNHTATAGIVSAKDRSRNELSPKNKMEIGSYIQTDAAINIGNSGGALVDIEGKLVGINTAIIAPTGVFAGYGFAIPSKIVKKVWIDIVKYGSVQKGLLNITGISIANVKKMLNQNMPIEGLSDKKLKNILSKYKDNSGILVANVIKNKAAYNAGIKQYDIITKINNVTIKSMSHLQEILIGEHRPGDEIKVAYLRKGVKKETKIILETNTKYRVIKKLDKFITNDIEGATFENVSKDLLKKYKIEGGVQLKKLSKGKWEDAGIKEGFIITSIVHLDSTKRHVPITNIKILCSELNSLIDKKFVIEGIYPSDKNKKRIFALYW
ncbi:MAG: PDZ domain-containing protein [Bacteroidetes bacterium]|nr:PDZ domain-containing protein [Bacteroidota bacterium]